jgi:hypothetical protein
MKKLHEARKRSKKMTLSEKAGAFFLSGRNLRGIYLFVEHVLVGPCLTHLETERFSLFVAFEYFVREEFNVRCVIIVPTDTNCGVPQSLVLPGAVNSNEIPFVQQPDHRDLPLFRLPVLRLRRLSSQDLSDYVELPTHQSMLSRVLPCAFLYPANC